MLYHLKLVVLSLVCFHISCIASDATGNFSFPKREKRSLLFIEDTACYSEVGCFSSGPPFHHPIFRPISVAPQPREVVNTRFMLFTRKNKNRPVFISSRSYSKLWKSPFSPKRLTRVIIHGLNDNLYFTTWMGRLKEILLKRSDENVIIVDWSSRNRLPYSISVANARLVGAEIALLVNFLQKASGVKPESFHLIGHSLGAHVAGYAGERLNRLGRITGLDPAGPFFRNVAEKVRLDPSDAVLVDIIHSDPGITILQGLGTPEDSGHLDFYPGGGDPPGCDAPTVQADELPTETIGNLVSCQHFRAYEYFQFSFGQNGCLFVGAECSSWESFNSGECDCGPDGGRCSVMGIFTPVYSEHTALHNSDRKTFLRVGPDRPYCVHQYQVIVYFSPLNEKKISYTEISMNAVISGDLEKLHGKLTLKVNLYEPIQVNKFLLSTDRHIGKVESISLHLEDKEYNSDYAHPTPVSIQKIRVTYLFPLPRKLVSKEFCKLSEHYNDLGKKISLSAEACNTT